MRQSRLDTESFPLRRHSFTCPHCGERISMTLDLSSGSQRYVEDCEVCCNPVEVRFRVEEGTLVSFEVEEA
jgi:transcription elongation factor Elf1